jgi:leucyl aminopeptidase
MPPQIIPTDESPTVVPCDLLALGVTSDPGGPSLHGRAPDVDAALGGLLSEHIDAVSFAAKTGDLEIVVGAGDLPARSIALVGLGPPDELEPATIRKVAANLVRRLAGRRVIASLLQEIEPRRAAVAAATEGFLLGSYQFTKYKSDPKLSRVERVLLIGDAPQDAVARARVRAEATVLARDLVNEPASTLTPDVLATRAREVADVAGLECSVLDERALTERGFGGILAVGAGSARPPRLIEMHYAPEGASGRVALVGKGVTFDSGGLSLKDARAMEDMKTDMSGAAAVIATMGALPRLEVSTEVLAFVPACENMPGGNALRPGDVIRHYGGRSTEVNNTDAEGRLVLGDALAFASEHSPHAMVDVATLTGGIVVALGRGSTGLFSNDDDLASALVRAAEEAGERMWPMPLYEDYKRLLDSPVADRKNSAGRFGTSITAALFLSEFVSAEIPWAHLDIAGTARSDKDHDEVARGGTGAATRTLLSWIEGRAR